MELTLTPSDYQKTVIDWLLNKPKDIKLSLLVQYVRMRPGITTMLFLAAAQSNWKRIYYLGQRRQLKLYLHNPQFKSLKGRVTFLPLKSERKEIEDDSVVILDWHFETIDNLLKYLAEDLPPMRTNCQVICAMMLASFPTMPCTINVTENGQKVQKKGYYSNRWEKEANVFKAIEKCKGKVRAQFIGDRPQLWNDDRPEVLFISSNQ